MRSLPARIRSLWQGLRRREAIEAEMTEEFRLHIELRAEDLVRSGLDPAQALRRARLEFGSGERYREEGRASRGLARLDELRFSWLDLKLGFRMLVRYPGLTLVAGLAMAFGVWVGAGTFEIGMQLLHPKLPLDEGERIVGVQLWDARAGRVRPTIGDLRAWRERVRSLQDLGGYRTLEANLAPEGGGGDPVPAAEISAAAFHLARVAPARGRYLLPADEEPGATAVAVIGHDLWQRRFAGDEGVVGREVSVGRSKVQIVGVMPPGFGLPIAQQLWLPLGGRQSDDRSVEIFGRLADGATLEEAQAELAAVVGGAIAAREAREPGVRVEPVVLPFGEVFFGVPPHLKGRVTLAVLSTNLVPLLLLLVICGNVGLLMFARAATRESELVVRSALGASRRRIITQLGAEALVLAGLATLAGLAAARLGVAWAVSVIESLIDGPLPFWFHADLSPGTMLYAAGLTLFGALIAGVLPAIRATRGTSGLLKQMTAGGGGMRFGRIWTTVIVTQVAITVVFPAVAFFTQKDGDEVTASELVFPSSEYVTAALHLEEDAPGSLPPDSIARNFGEFPAARLRLRERLEADPAVLGVTFASRVPRMYHQWNQVEIAEGAVEAPDERGHRVASATIDLDYFSVLGTPILDGRAFHSGDQAADARTVIVNESFVRQVLGGRNALGRHLRYVASESDRTPRDDGPWYEIVGVAPDLGMRSGYGTAGIYHPAGTRPDEPVHLLAHVKEPPGSFEGRIREAVFRADPGMAAEDVVPLDEVLAGDVRFYAFWFWLGVAVSGIALLLSLAGVYSVMSYTVARRTREIGIRRALGASPREVVLAILARPLAQVGLGVLIGGSVVALAPLLIESDPFLEALPRKAAAVAAYAVLMMGVCMLACVVPSRRALRVEPTEALRADG